MRPDAPKMDGKQLLSAYNDNFEQVSYYAYIDCTAVGKPKKYLHSRWTMKYKYAGKA